MQQRMALTPQMRQSIRLLGMSAQELNEYIDSLIEKNPLLQKIPLKKKPSTQTQTRDYYEKPIAQKENPRSSLISRIRMLDLSDKDVEIAEYLIYEMDDDGYLRIDTEEVAKDLMASMDEIERIVLIIQAMEPAGIGARDVRECLLLQLKKLGGEETLEYRIVDEFMIELARDDAKKIARLLEMDDKDVLPAIKNIKKLNPRPASTVLSKQAEPVTPDMIANIDSKNFTLELNREWLPHLRVYNPYEKQAELINDPEVKEFLKKNMNAAKELLDSLSRREETMCRVADYILKFQRDSIAKEKPDIKSLTLSDIGDALGMHPSTICRAVAHKYVQVNDKVVSLNALLSQGIKKTNGELASKVSVKIKIREFIDAEDKKAPLTDKLIKGKLEEEGINIKRRTVAKYRESLRILPTHLRKRRS